VKIQLKTDFLDYYDHWFDREGDIVFERMSRGGMGRREMFGFLKSLGLNSPEVGIVKEVFPKLRERYSDIPDGIMRIVSVVVYLDEMAHRGEGKERMSAEKALEKHPDNFCSEFIPTSPGEGSVSLRYLQIGDRKWWLRYSSIDDWRSNYGDKAWVEVLAEAGRGYHPKIKEPMFAVDFVAAKKIYAIDFNISPGLSGAAVDNILTGREVVDLIKGFYERA